MDKTLYDNKYRVATTRVSWHDYSSGAYFVTICTNDKSHSFGKILPNSESIIFTEIGDFLNQSIQNITSHYPYATIPLWQVMPNHVHLIIFIDHTKIPYYPNENQTTKMKNVNSQKGWLSVCVGGLKSAVSRFATQQNISFKWQSRFHEHIIRNQDDMNKIADYITNNIITWANDCFYNQ